MPFMRALPHPSQDVTLPTLHVSQVSLFMFILSPSIFVKEDSISYHNTDSRSSALFMLVLAGKPGSSNCFTTFYAF